MDAPRFQLPQTLAVLERTPEVLAALLNGLPEFWVHSSEGEGTWSPYRVVAHLIHGEHTNWMVRARHILAADPRPFVPFDRNAHLASGVDRPLAELLGEFATLRHANLRALEALSLTESDLARTGRHPDFGMVTLGQLLAAWVVHDLDHLAQITRTMAKTQVESVGPWRAYLSVLADRERPRS